MTQREARNVQILLDWVLNLTAFEHPQGPGELADEELVRVVGFLADRSWDVFGAGLRQDAAIAQAMRLLGMPTVTARQAAVDVVDLGLPANAGSAT